MADANLTYTSTPGLHEGTVIVRLIGPLTLTTIFDFQTEFRAMRPPVLILDLTESPYMDSAGLGLVMNKYVSAESAQRKFLIAGINARMELTKVIRVLSLFPTVAAAEASL
jgi:anti-anti-sigma factor